jgi:hypothetical protein
MSEQKIEEFYRDATADDVARVMRGERVEARFRNRPSESWWKGSLAGWTTTDPKWYCNDGGMRFWNDCQVYDPPAILKNKPEPGEGYRLLEKFPPEELWSSDEVWNDIVKAWDQTARLTQSDTLWYRRRIANSPTSSDSSRSRKDIPSGWRLLGKDEERLASDAQWSHGCGEWCLIGDDRVGISNELPKGHAIRQVEHQVDYDLVDGYIYHLPNGSKIRVTAKGFEVGS